jgi:hypothetical protein
MLTPVDVLDIGRETAQIIGVFVQFPNASLPLHETVVKNPASCPVDSVDVPSGDRLVDGTWKV